MVISQLEGKEMTENYKVFDLREFNNAEEAYKVSEKFTRCFDDELEEYLPHILIFKDKVEELTEDTYGPDDNFTNYDYELLNLNKEEIENYLKQVNT